MVGFKSLRGEPRSVVCFLAFHVLAVVWSLSPAFAQYALSVALLYSVLRDSLQFLYVLALFHFVLGLFMRPFDCFCFFATPVLYCSVLFFPVPIPRSPASCDARAEISGNCFLTLGPSRETERTRPLAPRGHRRSDVGLALARLN